VCVYAHEDDISLYILPSVSRHFSSKEFGAPRHGRSDGERNDKTDTATDVISKR